jgi:hypothetical protein
VLPTAEEEQEDPQNADAAYQSAVGWLKEHTRGEAYPRVAEETTEYGFRRNLRGLRWLALSGAVISFGASLLRYCRVGDLTWAGLSGSALWQVVFSGLEAVPTLSWGAVFVDFAAILFWVLVVRDRWVRQAGDQYARALLAACEIL